MNPLHTAVGLMVDTLFGFKSRIPVQKTELETAHVIIDAEVVAAAPAILPEPPPVEAAVVIETPAAEAQVEPKAVRKPRKSRATAPETPVIQQPEAEIAVQTEEIAPPAAEMAAATQPEVSPAPATATEPAPDNTKAAPFEESAYYATNIMPVPFDEEMSNEVAAEVAILGGTVTITKTMPVIPWQALELYRACAGEPLRYTLHGVYFDRDSAVGSNGHWLAQVFYRPWEMEMEIKPFILGVPEVKFLAKAFYDWKKKWKYSHLHQIIIAGRDETSVTFVFCAIGHAAEAHKLPLLDGQYPNIRRVFPVYERRESNEPLIGTFVNGNLENIGDMAARIDGADHRSLKMFVVDAHQAVTFVGHYFRGLVMPVGDPKQE